MAIVTINTPQGPLRVDIEGMSPSEEEMEIIRENAPARIVTGKQRPNV